MIANTATTIASIVSRQHYISVCPVYIMSIYVYTRLLAQTHLFPLILSVKIMKSVYENGLLELNSRVHGSSTSVSLQSSTREPLGNSTENVTPESMGGRETCRSTGLVWEI